MFGKEGGEARQEIVVAVGIGTNDHAAIVVAFQISDLAQQGDGVVAGGEAFGLPRGGDGICSIWWRWAGSSGMAQASHLAKSLAMPMLSAMRRRMPGDWRSMSAASRASSAKVSCSRWLRVP